MGVPVVSRQGDRHASRVGLSLLTAVGHPEWVAESMDDYVRIATELALDRSRLVALRGRLRAEVVASPLGDHRGQAERFGAALRDCWRRCCGRVAGPSVPPPEQVLS